jgi:hypothetical protein
MTGKAVAVHMRRYFSVMPWLALAAAAGCADRAAEKSYVQPGAVDKSVFTGMWYYRVTVTDHPYEAGFTFIGETAAGLEKIRWVIGEKSLYAFRAYETVMQTEAGRCAEAVSTSSPGSSGPSCRQDGDCAAGQYCLKDPASWYGAPVAAWTIESHFDVMRGYNPNTGGAYNYIEENTRDRPWHQRTHMRVDWSSNLVQDRFSFLREYADPARGAVKKEPASWYDQQTLSVTPEYIDVTNREIVTPAQNSAAPGSVTVTLRHSFLKVSPNSYYPMNYPDRMFDRFGYFRLDREGYDGKYGEADPARSLNICRWNLFKSVRDSGGNSIPARDREIRRVVFHLGREFPERLKWAAYSAVRDWDVAFRGSVAAMLETDAIKKMSQDEARAWVEARTDRAANGGWGAFALELRENDVCDGRFQKEASAGVRDEKCAKYTGDVRFSLIDWIAKPMSAAPLGYGPAGWDPESGEMQNAAANVYGAAVELYKSMAMKMYDLAYEQEVNDRDISDVITSGGDALSYFRGIYGGIQPEGPGGGPWKPAENAVAAIERLVLSAGAGAGEEQAGRVMTDPGLMGAIHARGAAFASAHPEVERALLGGELMAVRGYEVSAWDPAALADEDIEKFSPLREKISYYTHSDSDYVKSRFNCLLEQNPFMDLSVWRLVDRYRDRSRDEVAGIVEAAIVKSVLVHELGHALGLRHHFGGSADFQNYSADYWKIHAEVSKSHPGFDLYTAPETIRSDEDYNSHLAAWSSFRKEMKEKGADFSAYSSVMDYPHQWYMQGMDGLDDSNPQDAPKDDLWAQKRPASVGRYDLAAIKFGYGGVAERWDGVPDALRTNRKNAPYYFGGTACAKDADCPGSAAGQTCHTGACRPVRSGGTRIWDGGERCSSDHECPGYADGQKCALDTSLSPVCSEFYENADNSRDDGNPVRYAFCSDERTGDMPFCSRWDAGGTSREITANMADAWARNYIFNNFRRYRSGFGAGYEDMISRRYFEVIAKQLKGMLFNWHHGRGMRSQSTYARPGGVIDMYLSSVAGLNFFNSVLGMPDFGSYSKNVFERTYLRTDGEPGLPGADCSVRWGEGRYYLNRWEEGYYGRSGRLSVVGSVVDKVLALDAISSRGWDGPPADARFMVNYYDVFHNEVLDIFTGMITDDFSKFAMLAGPDAASGRCNAVPRNVWYGGQGSPSGPMFQRDPAVAYAGSAFIDPGRSFYNQYYPITYAFDRFPVYYDTGFFNYVKIWIKGEGAQFEPKDGVTDCSDPAALCCEHVSYRYPVTWRGLKVLETIGAGTGTRQIQRSAGCALIERANQLKNCWLNHPVCGDGRSKDEIARLLDSAESTMNLMRLFMQDYAVGY